MRRRLALIVALSLLAAPALGQDKGRITVMNTAPKTVLRPSQTVDPGALAGPRVGIRPAPTPPTYGAPPKTAGERQAEQRRLSSVERLPVLTPPPLQSRVDPGQCRMTCARTYYFCAAGESAEDCSTGWAQCRAGCEPSAGWRAPVGQRSGG